MYVRQQILSVDHTHTDIIFVLQRADVQLLAQNGLMIV